ncbi:MAG: ATP-binding protein [Pseudobdellovibrio sp.]
MVNRILEPLKSQSFFIFGARGTGKSTFLQKQFKMKNPFFINLLDPQIEDLYARNPTRLKQELSALKAKPDWVIIDEIQKVPKLLDMVHLLIEESQYKFILTGSSARKLKNGSSNLLAGRALMNYMFPLSIVELGSSYNLIDYLHWGGLPQLQSLKTTLEKTRYLQAYTLTYLNEEIKAEQIVRKLDPFRIFLNVVGQVSGKIINHKKVANEIGVDTKTIQSYFQILEDTLIGFYLPAFHESVRKSQKQNPKFYLFDTGVKKALEGSLEQIPVLRTSVFGELFEAFLVTEIHKLNQYYHKDFSLSYFATKEGFEIDLVLTKNKKKYLIEIKSSDDVHEKEVERLSLIAKEFKGVEKIFYLSQNKKNLKISDVECMHWFSFLDQFDKL